MSPQPNTVSNQATASKSEQKVYLYVFQYKEQVYDCSHYLDKHPGGKVFFDRMVEEKQDFTEYFRCLHSKKALKILKALPKLKQTEESQDSKIYTQIKKKVKPMFKPNWYIEGVILIALSLCMYLGVSTSNILFGICMLAFVQTFSGWVHHSANHNRDKWMIKYNGYYSIISGLSTTWWAYKHNNHHMFTNRIGKDDDINHNYKQWQYCFLFPKWKVDSILAGCRSKEMIVLAIHWVIILQQSIWIWLPSQIISSWFAANILIGNHEREKKFFSKIDLPFIEHQIAATRNYQFEDFISLIFMGGMQYQTEHHLFPQIPFYYLPRASQIIRSELSKQGMKIKIDSIF